VKAHHTYHLGTGTLITDATGEAYQFFMNLPFGETMIEQGGYDYDNPYKFNDYGSKKIKYLFTKRIQRSCELDQETGLYYYGARYYDPKISMWSSVDPLAEKYPSFNPYNYVLNNPVMLVDPTGMGVEDWIYDKIKKNYVWDKNVKSANDIKDKSRFEYVGLKEEDIYQYHKNKHYSSSPKINYFSFEHYVSNELIKVFNKIWKTKKEVDLSEIRGLYENAHFSGTNKEATIHFIYHKKVIGIFTIYHPDNSKFRFNSVLRVDTEETKGTLYPFHVYLINKKIWNNFGIHGGAVPTGTLFLYPDQKKLFYKFYLIDLYQMKSIYYEKLH